MSSSTSAAHVTPSKRSGRLDDSLLSITRGFKGNDMTLIERDADGFESFDEYFSQWLNIEDDNASGISDVERVDNDKMDIEIFGLPYTRLSLQSNTDDGQPQQPQEHEIDVQVSEYEIETDSNASTPPHIREQRERELEEMRLEEERKQIEEEEKKKAELERKRLEEEERKAEEERKRLEEEARKAEELRKAEEERKRLEEEARKAEEEKRRAEEEESKRVAELQAAAVRARKQELKAEVESALAEERPVPSRRNSTWTKGEAKKSILRARHSIAPNAISRLPDPPPETPKVTDEADKENVMGDVGGLVDYESDGSAYSRRGSIRSTKSRRESVLYTARSRKRVSIARGTQPVALVDYDHTPATCSAKSVVPDYASSAQTSPGSRSRRGSIDENLSNRVRGRLEFDLGDIGVPESKLKRYRRQSEVCAPPRVLEKGTLCRESLGSPEIASKKKSRTMVDCAIMCRGEEIDAEIAIMFGEFKLTTSNGVDIPPLEKPGVPEKNIEDPLETGSSEKLTPAKEEVDSTPVPVPDSTPDLPQPKVTFVEQAISVQTPGKTITHNLTESILENEPASALRANERMVAEFGEESQSKLRVVEIIDETREDVEIEVDGEAHGTPNSVAATIATSRRASIVTLPSNPTPSRRTRNSVASAGISIDSERNSRPIVSSAKPPKSPKSPSIAAVSSARSTRRSLLFVHSPSPRKSDTSPRMEDIEQPPLSPGIAAHKEPVQSPVQTNLPDAIAEVGDVTPNSKIGNYQDYTKKSSLTPQVDSVIKCASFAIPQNRRSTQKSVSYGRARTRSRKKSIIHDISQNPVINPIPFVMNDGTAIQDKVVEVEIAEKQRPSPSTVRSKPSTLSSNVQKYSIVSNVMSFVCPPTQAPDKHLVDQFNMNEVDIGNGELEDEVDVPEPSNRSSSGPRKSARLRKSLASEPASRSTRSTASRKSTLNRAKTDSSAAENESTRTTRSRTRSRKSKVSFGSPSTIKDSPEMSSDNNRRSSRRANGAASMNSTDNVEQIRSGTIDRRKSTRRMRASPANSTGKNSSSPGARSSGSSNRTRSARNRSSPVTAKDSAEEIFIPEPPADDCDDDNYDNEDEQIPVGSPFQLIGGEPAAPRVSDEEIEEVVTSVQKTKKKSTPKRGRKRTRRSERPLQRELANLERPVFESDEETVGRRVRRGKRARFQPLKFWENEKPVYERRDSQIMPTIKQLNLAVDPREAENEQSEKQALAIEGEIPEPPVEEADDEFLLMGDPLSPEAGEEFEESPVQTQRTKRVTRRRDGTSSSNAQVGPWRATPEKEQPAVKKRRKRRKRF